MHAAWQTLAAGPGSSARDDTIGALGILVILVAFVGSISLLWWRGDRRQARMKEREMAIREEQVKQQAGHSQREQEAYQRQLLLSELTADKIRLECRMLEAQVEAAERGKATRAREDEYHALAKQKIQLEIQSLRLHIKEQQKRTEDFSSYDDDE